MNMRKYKIKLIKFLVLLFMIITIRDLITTIKAESEKEKLETFNLVKHSNQKNNLDLKYCSDLGWYNLRTKLRDYEKGLDIVIPRFSRIYGPTILSNDSKAISQFLFKALNNEDIVLKSEGKQYYSFTYVYDAVYALLLTMLNGENGEAYNISYPETDKRLCDIADIIAHEVNRKVVFDLPSEEERKGFSKATIARMDNTKLKEIGFNPKYDLKRGIEATLKIIKEANNE